MDQNNNPIIDVQEEQPSGKKEKYKKYDFIVLIICLLIAVSIWVYVMNTSQDVIDREITLTLDVSGEIYAATGMTIFSNLDDSFEGSDMDYSKLQVTLKVSGPKNVIDRYTAEDYEIKVDTSEIQGAAVQRLSFLYTMPSPEITFGSIDTFLPTDMLYIDKEATTTLTKITAVPKNAVGSGASITMTPKVEAFNISGPERTINSITSASIVVDLSGMVTSSTISSSNIKIYGAEGEIKSSYLKISPLYVNVDVVIENSRNFPITFKQTTAVDSEYTYTVALTGDVSEIALYGDTALMTFDNFAIDLGDITKLSELTGTVAIKDLPLPKGLSLGEGMAELSISYVITKTPVGTEIGKS